MKTVSIVGFLVVILFFTGWSMYEDSKKRTVNENFSSGLLPWVVEYDTDTSNEPVITFSNDTMKIQANGSTYVWYDRKWQENYQVSFHTKVFYSGSESSWGCIWNAADSTQAQNFFKQTKSNIGLTPDRLNISSYCFISPENGFTRLYKNGRPVKEFQTLHARQWESIRIVSNRGKTDLINNEKTVASYQDSASLSSGYFGFYINNCTIEITALSFKQLK